MNEDDKKKLREALEAKNSKPINLAVKKYPRYTRASDITSDPLLMKRISDYLGIKK